MVYVQDLSSQLKETREYLSGELEVDKNKGSIVWVVGTSEPWFCEEPCHECTYCKHAKALDEGIYQELKEKFENLINEEITEIGVAKADFMETKDTVLYIRTKRGYYINYDGQVLEVFKIGTRDWNCDEFIKRNMGNSLFDIYPENVKYSVIGINKEMGDRATGSSTSSESEYAEARESLEHKMVKNMQSELERLFCNVKKAIKKDPSRLLVSLTLRPKKGEIEERISFMEFTPENSDITYEQIKSYLDDIEEELRKIDLAKEMNSILKNAIDRCCSYFHTDPHL